MVELTEAFVNALCAAGVHAAAAMPPETAPRLKAPAVGVSAAELETSPGGFSAYLGVQDGQELYGLRLRARMQLDVLSPTALGAGGCRAALDSARAVLAAGVEGVSILSVTAHAPAYDSAPDRYARTGATTRWATASGQNWKPTAAAGCAPGPTPVTRRS